MSQETMDWLNRYTLIGYTDKRDTAWHYRAGNADSVANHYAGAVPVGDVESKLFHWEALALPFHVTIPEQLSASGVTEARTLEVPGRVAIVHSETGEVLGVFRDTYKVTQYRDLLIEKLAELVGESRGDLGIGSAGLLKAGAVAWVMLESPENRVTPNGVAFREHILATTSHDGTLANTVTECRTVVVCDNTYSAAMGEGGRRYSSKHSKRSVFDVENARQAVGILVEDGDAFEREVMALAKKRVSAAKFGEFVEAWAPLPADTKNTRGTTVAEKKRATLTELYKSDDRVTPWKGTAWGVMQAVNTYGQHYAAVRNGSDDEKGKGAQRYARSVLAAADGSLAQQGNDTRRIMAAVGIL